MAKGPIPVVAARLLGTEPWLVGAAGVAVVVGQMWPVFLPSSGGKGNSTGLPMVLALAPGPLLVALVPILTSLLIRTVARVYTHHPLISGPPSNIFPLGMLAGFSLLPVAAYVMGEPVALVLSLLTLWATLMFRRLTAGLRADLRLAPGKARAIINRLLYDRSFEEFSQGE
jgi:glycerol-3-phosphate acyltransferase PlsY